jgi:hypothetical protein
LADDLVQLDGIFHVVLRKNVTHRFSVSLGIGIVQLGYKVLARIGYFVLKAIGERSVDQASYDEILYRDVKQLISAREFVKFVITIAVEIGLADLKLFSVNRHEIDADNGAA